MADIIKKELSNGMISSNGMSNASSNSTSAGSKKLKGEKVNCGELRKYLYGVEIYRQASMLRKGREVHKIYVDVHKGVSFLDDRFTLTEFGKMVLENGSVRAGRARNVRQIVVARETLYCSGTGGCKRACGGYGSCVSGCDKIKVRGHKCSFRVKLTMRLGFVDCWFVEILGSHNCYVEDGETPSDVSPMLADYEMKSSDGEDNRSLGASPLPDTNTLLSMGHNGPNFLESTPSPPNHPASFLLTPAHCPINVPVFPDTYLMTMARNAAAAVAMSNGNGVPSHHNSPLSIAALKREKSSPDIVNGLLSSSIIPPFGLVPVSSASSPSALENDHMPSTPPTDAMDLSTPRSHSEEPRDLSVNTSAIPRPASSENNSKSFVPVPCKASPSAGSHHNENSTVSSHDDDNDIPPASGLAANVFASIPSSSAGAQDQPSLPTTPMPAARSRKVLSRNYRNFQLPQSSVLFTADAAEEELEMNKMDGLPGSCEELDSPPDKELRSRVQQLEAHVTQLRNIVMKADGSKPEASKKQRREFDFTKYNTRHIALKIAYLGWDYHGFVVQEDTDKTIEAALFDALIKTRLIESRETSNYHRCGRTDKGVSALGQVISIDLRTNLLKGVGVKLRDGGTAHTRPGDTTTEIRYVHILNKVLPPEIRVLAWAPVDTEFSARFSCKKRTYKYFFPRGNLDIQRMQEAARKLVGEHDFRNLCKMDVGNGVVNFTRKILKAEIAVLNESDGGYSLCELTVVGQAFLWHQIRCIVAVLFLIAQNKEDINLIDQLLDVEKNPRKPQYTMSSELPLNLFDCDFGDDLEWVYEADWHEDNIRHMQQMWAQHAVKATMLKRMLDELDVAKVETESDIAPWNELSAPLLQQSDWLIPGNKPRIYKPLLKRPVCESLEERLEHYAKRKKVAEAVEDNTSLKDLSSS